MFLFIVVVECLKKQCFCFFSLTESFLVPLLTFSHHGTQGSIAGAIFRTLFLIVIRPWPGTAGIWTSSRGFVFAHFLAVAWLGPDWTMFGEELAEIEFIILVYSAWTDCAVLDLEKRDFIPGISASRPIKQSSELDFSQRNLSVGGALTTRSLNFIFSESIWLNWNPFQKDPKFGILHLKQISLTVDNFILFTHKNDLITEAWRPLFLLLCIVCASHTRIGLNCFQHSAHRTCSVCVVCVRTAKSAFFQFFRRF